MRLGRSFSLLIAAALPCLEGWAAADFSTDAPADWAVADAIVEAVELPRIPQRSVSIESFGAKSGSVDARPAILAAIEAASAEGGGQVVIPPGEWRCQGPIHLRSRIELHISEGATLLFSGEAANYLPVVKTRWEGTELYTYSPLIYARDVEDVAITGTGTIDGNAESEFLAWYTKAEADVHRLRKMGFEGAPVEERQFGAGTFLRPPTVQVFGGERVFLSGYKVVNSPFWVNHLVYVKHATVRNLRIDSHFPNNDGIDVESSSLVLVEGNVFRTGDDSVVIKSGRDLDGRTIGIPSTHIVVRNNDLGGEDGIGLGSEMSGGISHVYFTDNVLRSGMSAFRFKSNLDRGGLVEKIRLRNFEVGSFDTLFWFQLNYPSKLGGNFPATYRDIVFEDMTVEKVKVVFEAHAPQASPLREVLFKNIRIESVDTPFIVENAVGLEFENVQLGSQVIEGTLSWRER
ncbi:glycoside hydrolase family 28 protein [Pelagicoccus sp. SDUM812005]|uniref:glycoside hydrolase family 28 protein n=1 Tax=Pelagicoccus sp. SDUM812005 TaxID=3041257 RepID=UPI00280E1524|nr:glycoside hydrolase family 28 protein [Pelagicoccus sp. SDUM812005]MDQ8179151.1 glycoside hydrolase family 28 protein [Pelagicoccus sp. SDUM812005]